MGQKERGNAISKDANTVIKEWLEDSRTVTAALVTRYGPADEITSTLVTWRTRGPWKNAAWLQDGNRSSWRPQVYPPNLVS
jgi:hypothetical protein